MMTQDNIALVKKTAVYKAIDTANEHMRSNDAAMQNIGHVQRDLLYDLGLWPEEEDE